MIHTLPMTLAIFQSHETVSGVSHQMVNHWLNHTQRTMVHETWLNHHGRARLLLLLLRELPQRGPGRTGGAPAANEFRAYKAS